MEAITDIRAYLDSYEMITVAMSNRYYDGKCSHFHLRYPNGELKQLTIKSIEQYMRDETIYRLEAPHDLIIGEEYELVEEHAKSKVLEYSMIVKTKQFEEEFGYDKHDLGSIYQPDKTTFAVWAPTASKVKVEVTLPKTKEALCIELKRTEKGVFRGVVHLDLELATYVYLVRVNGIWQEAIDPYAKASSPNHKSSVVMNPAKLKVNLNHDKLPVFQNYTDAVIYEASVRDFSMALHTPHAGTFLGMMEEGLQTSSLQKAGFDYLVDLGITHLQLLPVYDFYTVDENHPQKYYNWGYDPIQWMVPEGSYASDVANPYSRILELKQLIAKMHAHGIRVIMDVVYNHFYGIAESAFEKIVPNYYFRRSEVGAYSNGSFCGNDFETACVMGRNYILDSCKLWMEEYGFDGFRFDLMGIIDVETMNMIVKQGKAIKPDSMYYGEGWNMPTMLPDERKAMMFNHSKLPYTAFFNDRYRDIIKGKSGSDEINVKGYASGNTLMIQETKGVLLGNVLPNATRFEFAHPTQSLNYVECHDNATCWDKLKECCKEDDRERRLEKQKLIIGMILVSQGIPFLHMGQEFCRTKNGVHNSYASSDAINSIDWERKDRYMSVVEYTKDMIALRKQFNCFRYQTKAEIEQHIVLETFADNSLVYRLRDIEDQDYEELIVLVNPTNVISIYELPQEYEIIANESGLLAKRVATHRLLSNPSTLTVAGKKRGSDYGAINKSI